MAPLDCLDVTAPRPTSSSTGGKNPKCGDLSFQCSGEGGFLVTSSEKLMATAVIHSGSYGHFHTVRRDNNRSILFLLQHIACPEDEQLMLEAHASVPNFSLRKVYQYIFVPIGKYMYIYICTSRKVKVVHQQSLQFCLEGKFTETFRMTPLAALLILDQLPKVEAKIEALNRNYAILEAKLGVWL